MTLANLVVLLGLMLPMLGLVLAEVRLEALGGTESVNRGPEPMCLPLREEDEECQRGKAGIGRNS